MKVLLIISGFFVLNGCTGYPDNIKPVEGFELNRYLGTWYEVARLDHSFERGLEQVSANYSMREDGGVKVVNRGFDAEEHQWNESIGRAYFVQNEHTGHFKVSFFGPFYGSYVVFRTGVDYQYAFVAGNNYDYLWLLSRTPEVPKQLRHEFIEVAQSKGYAVDDLIWVNQSAK